MGYTNEDILLLSSIPRPEGVVSDADMDRVFLSSSFEEILNMIQK